MVFNVLEKIKATPSLISIKAVATNVHTPKYLGEMILNHISVFSALHLPNRILMSTSKKCWWRTKENKIYLGELPK